LYGQYAGAFYESSVVDDHGDLKTQVAAFFGGVSGRRLDRHSWGDVPTIRDSESRQTKDAQINTHFGTMRVFFDTFPRPDADITTSQTDRAKLASQHIIARPWACITRNLGQKESLDTRIRTQCLSIILYPKFISRTSIHRN
jgi:hypothetical protein